LEKELIARNLGVFTAFLKVVFGVIFQITSLVAR